MTVLKVRPLTAYRLQNLEGFYKNQIVVKASWFSSVNILIHLKIHAYYIFLYIANEMKT